MKKYLIFPILSLFFALAGCETTDDEAMTIELASPKLKVTTELATATVTWDAIAKTAGYAYALDQSTEYVQLAADVTSVTLTQLAKGPHTFRIKAVGNLEHTTDSAERTIDFEIDPTLETPKPSYVKGEAMGSVTISWEEVKGAAGYAYKLDDDASWTNTVTFSGEGHYTMEIFAIDLAGNKAHPSPSLHRSRIPLQWFQHYQGPGPLPPWRPPAHS